MTTVEIIYMGVGAYLLATAPFDKKFLRGLLRCAAGLVIVVGVLHGAA